MLFEEAQQHGDLLQQDFIDRYRNLTLKAAMWISFVDAFCPRVSYILKMDDDAMINYFALVQMLQARSNLTSQLVFKPKTLACMVSSDSAVARCGSKWYSFLQFIDLCE
ncbi:unnamed protein product [Gongylonema pulchrum]|uniref:Hexosyltransferase n=1 Tax=Gongylonema pulchrum TaxID=637853 RepID=A0A3P6RFV8_9BILA|nr:unnamed protein product [Gongylonema pulchrum]